ncbi:aminotransferase class I and II [Candidatus Vecturithrix granuli]|uniref:Aminotransferase n=1 Tax=Vecturithrix granuli TaxID=1499967 RepID=A0A0S6WAD0_VECG1|nr:aminotransferase class I and II [Candidatus Vecturithrix granuli]
MDIIVAERIGGAQFGKSTEIYKFEKIKRAKAEARKKYPHIPLIDMGVGEPDCPADPEIVQVLAQEAGKPENRWYADNGIPEFLEAAAQYLKQVYQVDGLNPAEHLLHGIGSKPILALLPLCLINPGDITLTTIPGYPVIGTYTKYLGGEVYPLPLREENNFLPDLTAIPQEVLKRAKLMYVNYPNNPTGQVATKAFFQDLIEFALQHNVIIIQDAAYSALTYDGYQPLSFLTVEGAKEVGVEIHSLSKAFNMTGWRLAFLAGNAKIVKAYGVVKDNTDSGQFRAIQKAAIFALQHPQITNGICEKYSRRFDLLTRALNDLGFSARKPKASFYCYVKCPQGTETGVRFQTASDFSEFLLKEAVISTVPWDDTGRYIRFSVTFEAETVAQEQIIIEEMKERMKRLKLVFD